jgi:hypothetical protein
MVRAPHEEVAEFFVDEVHQWAEQESTKPTGSTRN